MKRYYSPALTLLFTSISMVGSIILPHVALGQTIRIDDETQSVLVDETTPSTSTITDADKNTGETNDNTATTPFVFQGSRFQSILPGVTPNSKIVKLLGEPRAKIESADGLSMYMQLNRTTEWELCCGGMSRTRFTYTTNNH